MLQKSIHDFFFVEKSSIFENIGIGRAHGFFGICITIYKLEFSDCSEVNRIFPSRKMTIFTKEDDCPPALPEFCSSHSSTVVSVRLEFTITFSFYPPEYKYKYKNIWSIYVSYYKYKGFLRAFNPITSGGY